MNPDVEIQFWDALAGGLGLAVAPLLIHLLPWGDSEVHTTVLIGTVLLMVVARRRLLPVPRRPGPRRGLGVVAVLFAVIGLLGTISGAWFATLRYANLKDDARITSEVTAGSMSNCVAIASGSTEAERQASIKAQCAAQQQANWETDQREADSARKGRWTEILSGIGLGCVGLLLLIVGGVLDLRWRRTTPPVS